MWIVKLFIGIPAKLKLYAGLALGAVLFLAAFAKNNQKKGGFKERLAATKKDRANASAIDKRVDSVRRDSGGVRKHKDRGFRDGD